jgi:hypothetical protein
VTARRRGRRRPWVVVEVGDGGGRVPEMRKMTYQRKNRGPHRSGWRTSNGGGEGAVGDRRTSPASEATPARRRRGGAARGCGSEPGEDYAFVFVATLSVNREWRIRERSCGAEEGSRSRAMDSR